MIKNDICPYCGVQLSRIQNRDDCRSVEHLVPRVMTTTVRKKSDGDFYTCRKCNEKKSKIDEVLSRIAMVQSPDPSVSMEAVSGIHKRIENKKGARYLRMAASARPHERGFLMKIPISGAELIEYMEFLGKGQYFIEQEEIFNPEIQVMVYQYANSEVLRWLEARYRVQQHSIPFRDLEKNPNARVIEGGQCTVLSQDKNSYLFLFHDSTAITIRVLPRSRKNYREAQKRKNELLRTFGAGRRNR
jgi:hypothetical protein